MKTPTEQTLARHFLAHRSQGYSIGYVLRQSKARYAILLGLILLSGFAAAEIDADIANPALWVFGLFSGALLRDIGWLRRIRGQWPFTEKIIDWRKVETIAAQPSP